MKKAYQKPIFEIIHFSAEHPLAGSDNTFHIGIDSDSSIDHESSIWVNKESDFGLWE